MRVLALVTLPTLGAGNRLRVEQYAAPLRSSGIDLVVSPFFSERAYAVLYRPGHIVAKGLAVVAGIIRRLRDLARAMRYDLVLVYRESAPLGPPIFERVLRALRRPYVFDFDDAIFLGPVHPVNRRWSWLRDPKRATETATGAVHVIAGNEYLADWARRHNRSVSVVTTAVDTDRHCPRLAAAHAGPLVLGWIGSSTTAPYLRLLDEALERLARRGDIVLRVVGGTYAHPTMPVEVRPYRLESETAELEGFDIGLLPEPDDPWTRGKGAFKALLYMATGLPVVASRVGVNPEVVIEGQTGYCVDDAAGWVEAIDRLADDAALRERLGAAGRRRAEAIYSLRALAPRVARILLEAARSA